MAALLALLVALVVAACGGTPGSDNDATTAAPAASDTTAAPAGSTAAAEPTVQMDGFESLGPVKLNVWSYDNQNPGLMPVIKELTKKFEAKYPNVKINLEFKDFNGLVNTVNRALASDNGPGHHRGQPGLPDRRRPGEGEADHPARQVRQGVRLGQVVGPGH